MTGKKRLLSLVAILTAVSMVIVSVAVTLLYNSAFEQQRVRLIDTVKSQASLIKAEASFDQRVASQVGHENIECDSFEATLGRLREAYDDFEGLGETGEFALARREGDQIIFLLNHRHHKSDALCLVSISSPNAEPMRRALRGESGTIVGLDYRGEQVLVAYEPVKELGLGLVAKIDISEIRVPFIRVGLISAGIAIVLILFGAVLFFRIGNPMVRDLIEKEARYRTLMNNLPVGVYRSTPEGKVISANPATLRCFGYDTEEEYLDKPAVDSFVDAERRRELLAALSENGSVSNFESQMVRKDGTVVWISTSAQATFGDDGRIEYFDGIEEDITERKQAEEALRESEEKYRLVIDNTDTGFVVVDEEGTVVEANEPYWRLIGAEHRDDIIGRSVIEWTAPECKKDNTAAVAVGAKEGYTRNFETTYLRNDGTRIIVLINAIMHDTPKGKRLAAQCRDITERKLTEEALAQSEERFRKLFHNAPMAYQSLDEQGNFLEVNQAWCQTLGYSREEVIGRNFAEFIDPGFKEIFERCFPVFKDAGSIDGVEHTMVKKDGTSIIASFAGRVGYNDDGSFKQTHCIFADITERKQAAAALKASEERFRSIIENTDAGYFFIDREGIIRDVNAAWVRMYKFSCVEDIIGQHFTTIQKSDDVELAKEVVSGIMAGNPVSHSGEFSRKCHDGSVGYHWFSARPVSRSGKVIGLEGFILDTTERKRAEEALQTSEERFKTLMVQSPLVMEIYDLDGLQIEVNQAYEKLWEFPASTTVNKFNVLKSKEVEDIGLMVFVKRAYAGEAVTIPEYIFDPTGETESGGHGRVRWLSTKIYPLKDSSGKVTSIVVTHEDITNRKVAEEALIKSEERHRRLFEQSNDPIFVHSLKGEILDVNNRACEMLGYSRDQLLSMTVPSLHPEGEMDKCAEAIRATEQEGSTVFESLFIAADGSVLDVSISSKIVDPKRGIIQGIVRNITETKRLQQLESRAERLETAGTIAGQVAHDFNNLLAPIMSYPELIREELPRDHPAHAYLDSIEEAAGKIAEINQDLLTMGRRGHYNQKTLDLNRIVLQATKEMESRTKTVTCETNLCQDLMKIKGGGAQIHRVLTNLMVNAQDAMGDTGSITIKTENYYADDTSIAFGRVPKGEYVKLTVSDIGCGIPDKITQKILDPFFTTKSADKKRGSGLGLSVVDAVMRDHGGFLDLSSRVGHGTSFYLYFPVTSDNAAERDAVSLAGGLEAILVVDDDNIQREVSTRLLTKLGYLVKAVESGERAIEFLRQNSQDLVILDMVMPGGIDGAETYRRIIEFSPNQKAIILSGFSESDRVHEAQNLGAGAFVRKPVSRKVIAAAIRTELDRPVKISAS